jgi:acylpyruvate hydrolase
VRLVTLRLGGGTQAGRIDGEDVVLLGSPDVGTLLAEPNWRRHAANDGPRVPLDSAAFAPLVPAPSKIFCLGLNYRGHIQEMGRELPEYPTVFGKFADALVGAHDDILLPRVSECADWEAELAFVVGRAARHVDESAALDHIAGYTILNDVSIRDYQNRTLQWLQGKTFERSTPLGPALVTGDEVGDAADLELSCAVDGEVMQRARTSDLLFSPARIVAYLSDIVTLRPGDVVSTGTPAGVGHAREPRVYLRPGQELRTTIEGLGELVNHCVAEA